MSVIMPLNVLPGKIINTNISKIKTKAAIGLSPSTESHPSSIMKLYLSFIFLFVISKYAHLSHGQEKTLIPFPSLAATISRLAIFLPDQQTHT
jgi:hypothetical protein